MLLGCIVVQDYVPPKNGDTAQITFVNVNSDLEHVYIFRDDKDCRKRSTPPTIEETGGTMTTTIAAGGYIAMGAYAVGGMQSCTVYFDFPVETGHHYEFRVSRGNGQCEYRLGDETAHKAVPLRERNRVTAVDENGSFCTPLP